MTLYLAIDSATDTGSVAVGEPGSIAAEVLISARRHAAALVPAVEECLRGAGASFAEVSGIIVADGPGSFTGVRIGFATVQGLVRRRVDLPVMTTPSMLSTAIVASKLAAGSIAVLYDALRGEVFAAIYRFEGRQLITVLPPSLTTAASLLSAHGDIALAVGDGAAVHAGEVRRWTGRDPLSPPAGGPSARGLIELVNIDGGVRYLDDVTTWEPDYGRLAEAQIRWERAHGKPLPGSVGDGS